MRRLLETCSVESQGSIIPGLSCTGMSFGPLTPISGGKCGEEGMPHLLPTSTTPPLLSLPLRAQELGELVERHVPASRSGRIARDPDVRHDHAGSFLDALQFHLNFCDRMATAWGL